MSKQPLQIESYYVDRALGGRYVVAFGEVNKATARHLNKLAREGRVDRCDGCWCNFAANRALAA